MQQTIVLMVWRPEADRPHLYKLKGLSPFSGIEVLGIFGTEAQVNAEIDKHMAGNPNWKFHYETVVLG